MKLFFACIAMFMLVASVNADVDKDRQKILDMRQKILTRLYSEDGDAQANVNSGVGYATFSNIGINILFLSTGNGSGVVHNNKTGSDTFMRMFSAGVGLGLGIKDFSVVFVFKTQQALTAFIDEGWDFSAQADAAAKSNEKGGESSIAETAVSGVDIYQMTENGLALQATLQGTKYWKNDKLN